MSVNLNLTRKKLFSDFFDDDDRYYDSQYTIITIIKKQTIQKNKKQSMTVAVVAELYDWDWEG